MAKAESGFTPALREARRRPWVSGTRRLRRRRPNGWSHRKSRRTGLVLPPQRPAGRKLMADYYIPSQDERDDFDGLLNKIPLGR
jgi:hypothetical protein